MPIKIKCNSTSAMLASFKTIINTEFSDLNNKTIYLAISGGKDSIALSQLLLKSGFNHTLLHCNFQLRNNESDLDEQFILQYGKDNNLTTFTKKFDTKLTAEIEKNTIQETARNLRYNWFKKFLITNDSVLLTAHHLDDTIETFFINLMRGTGIKGLNGIKERNGKIIRPLLHFSSLQIEQFIQDYQLTFRQDKSNFDNKYLRNLLRNEIIPQFENKSTDFKTKVSNTITSLKQITQWMEKQANTFRNNHFSINSKQITISKSKILAQDNIFLEFIFAPYNIHRSNIKEFIKTINSATGAQFITNEIIFTVNRDEVIITQINASTFQTQNIHNLPFEIKTIQGQNIKLIKTQERADFKENHIQQFDLERIKFPLCVRNWKNGDRIQPLGMKGSKLVSDILINKKLSVIQKEKVLVLTDTNDVIISIIDLTTSEKFKLNTKSTNILNITTSKHT